MHILVIIWHIYLENLPLFGMLMEFVCTIYSCGEIKCLTILGRHHQFSLVSFFAPSRAKKKQITAMLHGQVPNMCLILD
jgi:hypothetical protein